ncbi:MAG: DUF4148 domain-containing protein [Burkholderiaceae bacterium]
MNTKFIASSLIAVAALASSAAFAGAAEDGRPAPIVSQFSRAEVQADYVKAAKEGSLPVLAEAGVVTANTFNTGVSRAEIKEQAVQWAHAKNKPVSELM